MSIHPEFLQLGQQLKEQRESLELSLKQISEKTKISVSVLQAIEEGQYNQFPVYAYLRGFIVSYAQVMDMDLEGLLQELESIWIQSEQKMLSSKVDGESLKKDLMHKKFHLTPVILASGCLFILFFSLILYSWFRQNDEVINMNYQTEAFSNENKLLEEEKKQEVDRQVSKESSALTSGLLQNDIELEVIVKALEEVTFSYSVDKETVRKMNLKKDQFEVFKGKKKIWIKTDKADRIRIFYNGDDKGIFGFSGEKEQAFSIKTREPSSSMDNEQ